METAIKAAKEAGFDGIAVWSQGNRYIAAVLNREGQISEPRNWDAHPTAVEALAALTEVLRGMARKN